MGVDTPMLFRMRGSLNDFLRKALRATVRSVRDLESSA